jgi:hypothetical protein
MLQDIPPQKIFENNDIMNFKRQSSDRGLMPFAFESRMSDVEIACTITFQTIPISERSKQVNCTDLVPMVESLQEGRKW